MTEKLIQSAVSMEGLDPSLEAVLYDNFYRRRGIRRYMGFTTPRVYPLDTFELPKNAIVHYLPESEVELGITATHLFLRKATAMILSEHIEQYSSNEGSPVKLPVQPTQLITRYRRANRTIRLLHNYDTALRQEKTAIVVNYSLLNHLYRYRPTRYTRLHRFHNLYNTLLDKMNSLAEITDREQYLEMTVPRIPLTKELLVRASGKLNAQLMARFPDNHALLILELWKWLGDQRDQSIFSRLSEKALAKVQLVWTQPGGFTMISLKNLNEWRKDPETGKGTVMPKQMQIALLKFLSSLFEVGSVSPKTTIEIASNETEDGGEEEEVQSITIDGEELDELAKVEEEVRKQLESEDSDYEDSDTEVVVGTEYQVKTDMGDVEDPPSDEGPLTGSVIERADELLEQGLISVPEHRRYSKLATALQNVPDPYGSGKTYEDAMRIDPNVVNDLPERVYPEIKTVLDKSMLNSTLQNFDKSYIRNVMKKDLMGAIASFNKAGIAVTDHKVEVREDANSKFEVHTVRLTPVGGTPSTFTFTMPVVDEEGVYRERGNKYRLRRQRADLPIRKISSSRVGLTTYYSKLFVDRSGRKAYDYGAWLVREVNLLTFDREDKDGNPIKASIKNAGFDNVFDATIPTPRQFAALSTMFTHFDYKGHKFMFDMKLVRAEFGDKKVNSALREGEIPIAMSKEGKIWIMSNAGTIYEDGTDVIIGSIEEILGLNAAKAPTEVATMDVMGKEIPLGIVLCFYYGFSKLLRKLRIPHRKIRRGSPMELRSDEFIVKFKDQTVIIPRSERLAGLIFGGFNLYSNSVGSYDLSEFDRKDVYGAVLEMEGLGARYYRELELMLAMYIDNISEEILKEMKEPTYFPRLLLRAAELLLTDDHPDENDARYRRFRGYERMIGHLYTQMVNGIRYYKAGQNNPKAKVEINPMVVSAKIQSDPSVTLVDEINPYQNTKEIENTTFSGTGGRKGRTMVRRTRSFHPSEIGLISEATVDSQDVAVTTFTPPNPKLKNLRGLVKPWDYDPDEAASLMSTYALISPGADTDDPKRINFISIQKSHTVPTIGYQTNWVRTGYEDVMAQRNGSNFSHVAKGKGRIAEVIAGDRMKIVYDDPDLPDEVIELGTVYGKSAGHTIAHKLTTDLPEGKKVKAGDVVAFNSNWSTRSLLDDSQVSLLAGVPVTVAWMDTPDVLEDSCAISPEVSEQLTMNSCHTEVITIRFDQVIRNLVGIGEDLSVGSILCNIEDAATSRSDALNQNVMDSLKMLAQNSPTSHANGKVGSVEILYHGDLDDMNDALRELVMGYDRQRAKRAKLLGSNITSGEVADLDMDTVQITIQIEGPHGMGDGDKAALSHQLKSTVHRVMVGKNTDGYGNPIGVIFGYTSEHDRIVNSARDMGTTMTLVKIANKRACNAYREAQKKSK